MRRSRGVPVSFLALAVAAGIAACRDVQPTASRATNPLTLTSSASRVAQLRTSDQHSSWTVQRTVTTTPGENGNSVTSFDGEEAPIWHDIGDYYADYGIHFVNAMGIVLSSSSYYPPRSGSTIITAIIPPTYTGGDGHVTINFDFPISVFGAYATSAEPLSLSCSDSTGTTVGTAYLDTPNLNKEGSPFGPNQNIEVRGEGITRCVFDGSNNLYGFDDFYFSRLPQPKLTVNCDPDSPMPRGEWLRCIATLEPKKTPFTIIERRAEAEGHVYTDTTAIPVNGERGYYQYSWAGNAVVDTKVTMKARVAVGGDTVTVKSDPVEFRVKSRMDNGSESWPKLSLPAMAPEPKVDDGTKLNYPPYDADANGHWRGTKGGLGMTHVTTQYFYTRDSTGPNTNWLFIVNPVTIVDTAVFYSRHLEPTDSFYQQQNGKPVQIGKNRFKGCASADMDAIRLDVFQHEKAHYAVYHKYYAEHDVQADFEGIHIYLDPAAPGAIRPDRALNLEVWRINGKPLTDLQAPIDSSTTAYPVDQPCDLHGPFPRT